MKSKYNHRFTILWISSIINEFGNKTSIIAMPLIAISLFDTNVMQTSFITVMQFLPFLLFSVIAGHLVNSLNKKVVLLFCNILSAFLTLVLILGVVYGTVDLWMFYLFIFVMNTLGLISGLAYSTLIKKILTKDEFLNANHKLTTTTNLNRVISPTIGGSIVELLGSVFALALDAATFLLAFIVQLFVKNPEKRLVVLRKNKVRQHPLIGLKIIFSNEILKDIYIAFVISTFTIGIFQALQAYYLVEYKGVNGALLGIIYTFGNIVMVIFSYYSKTIIKKCKVVEIISLRYLTLLLTAIIYIVTIFISNYKALIILFVIAQVLIMCMNPVYSICVSTLRQKEVRDDNYANVIACWGYLVRGVIPISALLSGYLVNILGYLTVYSMIALLFLSAFVIFYRKYKNSEYSI